MSRKYGSSFIIELGRSGVTVFCAWLGISQAQAHFSNITAPSGIGAIVNEQYAVHPQWWLLNRVST